MKFHQSILFLAVLLGNGSIHAQDVFGLKFGQTMEEVSAQVGNWVPEEDSMFQNAYVAKRLPDELIYDRNKPWARIFLRSGLTCMATVR